MLRAKGGNRPRGFNLNFCLPLPFGLRAKGKQRVETKNKNKSKRWKKLRLANYYTINYFFIFTLPSLCTKAYPFWAKRIITIFIIAMLCLLHYHCCNHYYWNYHHNLCLHCPRLFKGGSDGNDWFKFKLLPFALKKQEPRVETKSKDGKG